MASFSDLAQNIFKLNGVPLNIDQKSMKHLYPIYNRPDDSVLLKFGRQTHKSSTVGYKITLPCLKYPNYHAVYIAPTGNQVSVFSTDKLDGALRNSSVIQKNYVCPKTKDQIQYKELKNESKIYLRSAFRSADAIRGISGDMTCIDEVQDILSDHIPVIEQCMSHSLNKHNHLKIQDPNIPMHIFNHKMYAGTPKTVENTLEHYWNKSTQNEWIIKCTHCNKWNYINENNIGLTGLICNKCGQPIYYKNGQWVTMNKGGFIQGYRLPQIVLNWINDITNQKAWQINVIQPRETYTSQKFFNEVLALPYANAKNPITPAHMRAACKDYDIVSDYTNPMLSGMQLVAGIDWGKGDTTRGTSYSMLTIGMIYKSVFRVVYIKKYSGGLSDAVEQVEDMLNIIRMYGVKLTLADTGDGRTSNALMVNALGPRSFAEVYEHGSQKKKITWDSVGGKYVINRTQMMLDRFMEIRKGKIEFFKYEHMAPFVNDFLSIYSDYSEATRLTRYDHTAPDDAFHSFMFCRIASLVLSGELSKYLVG